MHKVSRLRRLHALEQLGLHELLGLWRDELPQCLVILDGVGHASPQNDSSQSADFSRCVLLGDDGGEVAGVLVGLTLSDLPQVFLCGLTSIIVESQHNFELGDHKLGLLELLSLQNVRVHLNWSV